jgi:hypothetical protein
MLKIAFLFLTISGIYHEEYWQDFFRGNEQKYSIHVHSKYDLNTHSWFKQFELPYKMENSWARTMKCQIGMLKEALKDPDNQMFIFCSQNTLPLQSFDFIYDELISIGKSMFKHEKNPHMDPEDKGAYQQYRVLKPIPEEKQHKNSQWIILNRKHAQMMVNDEQIIRIISCYPCDQEHYPSTFLALHGMLNEVHKREGTLVAWHMNNHPPYIFKDLDIKQEYQTLTDAITYGTYFVRKVDEKCKLKPLDKSLAYRKND